MLLAIGLASMAYANPLPAIDPGELIQRTQSVLKALYLIPPNTSLKEMMLTFYGSAVIGYYDTETKDLERLSPTVGKLAGLVRLQGRTGFAGTIVLVRNKEGQEVARSSTVADGTFALPSLPPGEGYTVQASFPIYLSACSPPWGVETGETASLSGLTLRGGDVSQDGAINAKDLALLASRWAALDPQGDVNRDGVVNLPGLVLAGKSFGQTFCP